jgi:uncharacterized protein YegJ (DUF2314 family)
MKLLSLLVAAILVFSGCSDQRPDTLVSSYDQNAMTTAISTAKARVDEFIAVLQANGADSFSVKAPITDSHGTEHFWIVDVSFKDGVFTGKVGNQPGIVKNVQFGQEWRIAKADISDWMYARGEKIHGGFTIDPLLGSYPKDEADAMRARLVR